MDIIYEGAIDKALEGTGKMYTGENLEDNL